WGFVPPLGDYKYFVYMSIDDRVFVPPSDVTRIRWGHTGGVPSPAEVSRARASRASASAEADEPAEVP
ncbi:hypothetical protein Taro_026838, partial [Colocasia esculenta]|nr:hypothetical protein [Colocasia esculenta]